MRNCEVSDDVVFHTAIICNDFGCIPLSIHDDFFGRDFGNEISFVRVAEEVIWVGLRCWSLGVLQDWIGMRKD